MRHQLALQPVGKLADNADDIFHMPVEHKAQPVQLFVITKFGSRYNFIKSGIVNAVGIFSIAAILWLAVHVGMRGLAVCHAIFGAISLDHLRIIAGTAITGIFHRLAVLALALVVADRRLFPILVTLGVTIILAVITIIFGLILIGCRISQICLQRADEAA